MNAPKEPLPQTPEVYSMPFGGGRLQYLRDLLDDALAANDQDNIHMLYEELDRNL
jgi:hypothetical protein